MGKRAKQKGPALKEIAQLAVEIISAIATLITAIKA